MPNPQSQVFWYLNRPLAPEPLHIPLKTDVVIIGGGMAGLSAAQAFREKGYSVVLLEKYYCGAGATGKSSGFVTPDSEIGLRILIENYGQDVAKKLWEFVTSGVHCIHNNITTHNFTCDYQQQDCLLVANSKHDIKKIDEEYAARQQLNYPTTRYTTDTITQALGTPACYGAIRYGDTFGINAYAYCQETKQLLQNLGVAIYEETGAIAIAPHKVITEHAYVEADYIIMCTDRFTPDLGKLQHDIYHAQTFLLMSSPVPESTIRTMFPSGNCMTWDTDLIYSYYRVVQDNRIMVGGSNLFFTYASHESYASNYIYKKLSRYFAQKFPHVTINFEYMWPGMIGISKDMLPIAGFDAHDPSLYYISAATGLPWAAALGKYCAQRIIDNVTDFDTYFSPYRSFPIGHTLQRIIGTKATFALSNGIRLLL